MEAGPRGQPIDDAACMDSQEEPDSLESNVLLQQGEVSPSPGAAPAPAAAEGEGAQRSEPRRTRRAAKMLCRAGLRCACHFVLRKDCPDRSSQP